jgi:hypothetical protein
VFGRLKLRTWKPEERTGSRRFQFKVRITNERAEPWIVDSVELRYSLDGQTVVTKLLPTHATLGPHSSGDLASRIASTTWPGPSHAQVVTRTLSAAPRIGSECIYNWRPPGPG